MIKISVRLVLMVLFLVDVYAVAKCQEALTIVSGEPFDIKNGKISNLLVQDENNFYLLHLNDKGDFEINSGSDAVIEVFDKDLKHISTIPLHVPDNAKFKKLEPVSYLKTDSGFLLLVKNYDLNSKVIKSIIFKISNKGFILSAKDIGEIDEIAISKQDFGFFQLNKIIENRQIRFVYSQIVPPDIGVPERVNFIIYDENLEITSERMINFPDDILDYEVSDIIIDETGFTFFRIETNDPYRQEKTVHQLIIYDILNDKNQNIEFNPEIGEISKATLQKVEGDKVGFFGYLTKKHGDPLPSGMMYYLFDAKGGQLLRHEIYDMSREVLSLFNPDKLFSTSGYEQLKPQVMHLTTDNHILLLFEYNWKKLMIIQDREGKIWSTPYFYANEIFILNFDSADTFENAGVVPKEQLHSNDFSEIGFSSFVTGKDLTLIYNDHPKNADEYKTEKLKTMKSSFVPMIVHNNYLYATYQKEILKLKNTTFNFEPGAMYKISDNAILLFNYSKPFNLIEIRF
jgi:hypothetical protein